MEKPNYFHQQQAAAFFFHSVSPISLCSAMSDTPGHRQGEGMLIFHPPTVPWNRQLSLSNACVNTDAIVPGDRARGLTRQLLQLFPARNGARAIQTPSLNSKHDRRSISSPPAALNLAAPTLRLSLREVQEGKCQPPASLPDSSKRLNVSSPPTRSRRLATLDHPRCGGRHARKNFHRITEWSGLEGTSVGHLVQPSC